MRIGIDMMGGDYAPGSTIRGSILAREALPDQIELFLFGDQDLIRRYSEEHQLDIVGMTIVHTPHSVSMGDHPFKAFREKPDSSVFTGQRWIANGSIDGFCSAGNTGAMMVGAMQIITSIPGIIRPAIAAPLPNMVLNRSLLLDVGLNPDARPDVLYQYGTIGTIYSKLVHEIAEPKVALLNMGQEEEKGNMATRSAYQIMKDSLDFDFIGNFEANELFVSDRANVIVTDGFTGNVVLKEAEAFYRLVAAKGVCNGYFEMFNFENFGGTPVLGINGSLIIGHGVSTAKAVKNMLLHTVEVVEAGLVKRIKEELNR
ncbi:MAG: phosphate--acyl-ACP acyltransferase [Bacteroidales bacterium]